MTPTSTVKEGFATSTVDTAAEAVAEGEDCCVDRTEELAVADAATVEEFWDDVVEEDKDDEEGAANAMQKKSIKTESVSHVRVLRRPISSLLEEQ